MAKTLPSPGGSSRAGSGHVAPGADGLIDAALRCFYEVGYSGTAVRQIASEANVTVAALYHHFESKQDILYAIMSRSIEASLSGAKKALASVPDDPTAQLAALVEAMVRYHTQYQKEAFVGNSELRSLEGPGRTLIVARRDAHEEMVSAVIQAGVQRGVFRVDDPANAARAILAMCIAVASWYRKGGGQSAKEIGKLYATYALKLVGSTGA